MEDKSIQYTFWELIKNYKIVIPIIQRDYAQGREGSKISEIRQSFLNTLYEMIDNKEKSVDLDFVYGSIKFFKNSDSESEDAIFTPLDGQQRLTTLFLLHWYLARAEDGSLSNEHKEILKNFTYETRTSSKEFCRELISNCIVIEENCSAKESIINSSWFFLAWQKDPTIKSMLNMLEDIHKKFYNNRNDLFFNLISEKEKPITFQFLELNNFGLTDSLYIKMNARGKPLTEFENFKAKFEQFLESKKTTNSEELNKEFSMKIDGVWTDFFWKHRDKNHIDDALMRYFLFISEMLYYKDNNEQLDYLKDTPIFSFKQIENIYLDSDGENIKFLFNSFDLLHTIDDMVGIFDELFAKNMYDVGKVNIFSENIYLFQKCINSEDFGIFEKVLFFAMIQYMIYNQTHLVDDLLENKVRILRNLLLRVRQQNQTKFNSNLRYENMSKFIESSIMLIENDDLISIEALQGFSKDSFDFEKNKKELLDTHPSIKAVINELEDNKLLQGSIHNIDLFSNPSNAQEYSNTFKEIWTIEDNSLIVRALLTIDDYSIRIGWNDLGSRWYFGKGENWHTILTNANKEFQGTIKETLKKFFEIYINLDLKDPIQKLNKIIVDWLEMKSERDWVYYFVKYPEIISESNSLFTWKYFEDAKANFEIRSLSGDTLRAWHINPYVNMVYKYSNLKDKINYHDCHSKTSVASPLVLEMCELWCMEDGWHIYTYDDYNIKDEIKNNFNLIKKLDNENIEYFLLQDTDNKDRIEIAIEFIGYL